MKALPLAKPPFGELRVENPDHFAAVYVNGHFMEVMWMSSAISRRASY